MEKNTFSFVKKTHWSGCDDLDMLYFISQSLTNTGSIMDKIYPSGRDEFWPDMAMNFIGTHRECRKKNPFIECGKIGVSLHLKFDDPGPFFDHYAEEEEVEKKEQVEKLRIAAYYLEMALEPKTRWYFDRANDILGQEYQDINRIYYPRPDGRYSPNLASSRTFQRAVRGQPEDVYRVNFNIFEKNPFFKAKLRDEAENALLADGMFNASYRELPYNLIYGSKRVIIPDHPCLKAVEYHYVFFSNKWLNLSENSPHSNFIKDAIENRVFNVNNQIENFKFVFRSFAGIPYQLPYDLATERWRAMQWAKRKGYDLKKLPEFHDPIEWDIQIYDEKFK